MYAAPPAGASTVHASSTSATFSSSQIGSSGSTPQFAESGPWLMSWSYNCSAYGSKGNFQVSINPAGGSSGDIGPNELGTGGSGTDYYYDTGSFNLTVNSECAWSITVSPTTDIAGPTATFSSTQTGDTGETVEFPENGPWKMAWSYDCSAWGSQGNFQVDIQQRDGGFSSDIGPNELGTGGSGTDSYFDTGTFNLAINSECSWSITVSPAGASQCNTTLPSGSVVGMATTPDGKGYWIASSNGTVASCGDAPAFGNGPNGVAAIASAPSGFGFWLATGSGAVYAFGSAAYHGGLAPGTPLAKPIVAMAADPATGGYWLLGGDGGVFSYDAPFYGSTGNIRLAKPAVGMEATLDGNGYRFVASDGGVFDYGDAQFYGSTGGIRLNKPVVGIADDPATGGYWLDASDGGIFSYNAPFYGSTGNIQLAQPCVGMTSMPDGYGYRFVAADGGIFDFGSAPFEGSAAS